jgi:hypothetical protein
MGGAPVDWVKFTANENNGRFFPLDFTGFCQPLNIDPKFWRL